MLNVYNGYKRTAVKYMTSRLSSDGLITNNYLG